MKTTAFTVPLIAMLTLVCVAASPAPASADAIPNPLAPYRWAGTWRLTATTVYSTCKSSKRGDYAISELTIGVRKGYWVAREVHKTSGQKLNLQVGVQRNALPPALIFRYKRSIGLDLWLTGSDVAVGRRVVARDPFGRKNACAVVSKITAKRKK